MGAAASKAPLTMRALRVLTGGLATLAVTSVVGYAIAYPQGAPTAAAVRALADCAAVGSFGLAIVPALEMSRRRGELASRAAGPLIVVSAAWLVAEFLRQLLAAAQTAALPLLGLPVRTVLRFTLQTVAGRAGLLSVSAAAVVCAVAASGRRSPALSVTAAGAAAIGLAARVVAGHLSESPWGAVAVALHVLAAAAWCGGLAALAVTVTHRGQWARVLPRFSQLALVCVTVLLASGALGAVLAAGAPVRWYASGYGRVLMAKVVLAVALVVLAWRNRTGWLPAARSHRTSAGSSQHRSAAELVLMVAALTLAAALAVTG
jgi:copper resistance protein D